MWKMPYKPHTFEVRCYIKVGHYFHQLFNNKSPFPPHTGFMDSIYIQYASISLT